MQAVAGDGDGDMEKNPSDGYGPTQMKFRVPGDVVNQATQDLPDDQRNLIRWFHMHISSRDLTLGEAAKLIHYTGATTISKVFTGNYGAGLANVCKQIASFKKVIELRSTGRKVEFVETALAKKIWKVCTIALEYQRIAFIFGETQIGKSEALIKYRDDHNHGSTIYVVCPAGGSFKLFLIAMARALRINQTLNESDLRRRIIDAFDDRMLLIVDEAHQCCYKKQDHHAAKLVEFVREIYDAKKCGVVICATNVFRDEMENGRLKGILKQTKRRRVVTLQLPAISTLEDLHKFSALYELEPATGQAARLQLEMNREEGLGMWLTLLRMAAKLAARERRGMSWQYVIDAHTGLKDLEAE